MFDIFHAIVEQAPDAIILADRSGCIRMWNRAAERLFGYSATEVMGQRLDVIIPERLRPAHWAAFDEAIANGRTRYDGRPMTTRSVHKDGSKLYVDLSFALVFEANRAVVGALAFARDATNRHESERALRERVTALENALAVTRAPR